jgi:signal transduction histidine kinase
MKRFFEFLLPERTHLKAVIAALVAIFVLSGVLAFQVRQSEIRRQKLAVSHIQSFQEVALDNLSSGLERSMWNHLRPTFAPAVSVAEEGGSAGEIGAAVDLVSLRGKYSGRVGEAIVFNLGDKTQASKFPAWLPAYLATRDTINSASMIGTWVSGVVAKSDGSGGHIYAFATHSMRSPATAIVVELPHGFLPFITATVLRDGFVSPKFTKQTSPDSIFRVSATLAGFGTVLENTSRSYAAMPADTTLAFAFFPGLTWTVGILPVGRDLFVPPIPFWLSPNLLLMSMIMIGAVILMAIALVRREEELHRLRSDLISGVSHELRTPLAQIRMFAETLLLGRTRTEGEKRRSLEVIDQEAKRLSHFVENMLQFAKGEGGRTRLVPEPTSFALEVRRAVEGFGPMCQARGVEVRTELEEGVTATVDRAALRRIMLNLMENALKYGPDEQRITVGIALFDDVVRLWVDDEGEGIPRLDRERVFDSFYRLNRDLDRRVTGSGIGLAVVRQLATLHGGRAWAEDAPGGGARLVVEFPDAYVRPHEDNTGWAVA